MLLRRTATTLFILLATTTLRAATPQETEAELDRQFSETVRPFVNANCVQCHGGEKPKAEFDLQPYSSLATVIKGTAHWMQVREKLVSKEMPPEEAKVQPTAEDRQKIIDWIDAFRKNEAAKHAGDPGIVLLRRLSNAEYDYTIRDLTGFDLQPTREFPIDPANTAGFDNSGESLAMSPGLLNKYLKAARDIANHMYLQQNGIGFAEHAMLSETDRDRFCELQIVNFYHTLSTDYADYFQSAWRFKNRAALGKPDAGLAEMAISPQVSPKYLATVWAILEEAPEQVGPVAKLQAMWHALPAPDPNQPELARRGAEQMRDYVVELRKKVEPRFTGLSAGRGGGQAAPMWLNTQYATHRMTYDPAQLQVEGEAQPMQTTQPATAPARGGRGARGGRRGGRGGTITNTPGDPDLTVPAGQRAQYEASFARFCSVFPDRFYTQQRGTNYFNEGNETGRLLSAGFLNRMGYFRDDVPFYELILDKQQQQKLDSMWVDFDFIANATRRTFLQSFDVGSASARALLGDDVNAAPDDRLASEATIKKYTEGLVAAAAGSSEMAIKVVQDYYQGVNDRIRWTEKARVAAEPSHLDALLDFAARAYRRPLTKDDRDELLAYYRSAREDGLDHESAIRDTIVFILISPNLTYRIDLSPSDNGVQPLSDYDLASRLSYFLWASMPDAELLSHAAAGDLHEPKVIAAQARRMLQDPRARGLAVEFGGNWLDFRRFEDINTVDRQRFSSFTNELRDAMFEEPVRFLLDVVQKNRSILDLLYANDTFVNPVLAKHYGMPEQNVAPDEWVHIQDASPYSRGGILPMAAFMTKNAPGLRTSPVKRGHWVAKNVLGEVIAPPPANVPLLPSDESKLDQPLRQMLAQHRDNPACAGCHERFDSLGLVFEGFGTIGDRRDKDLAGRAIDPGAVFPDGSEGAGLEGLRKYIREKRQDDFINNVSQKLLVYALGRSLIPSDDLLIQDIHGRLVASGYRFETIVESIVTSPQFLTKRGRDALAER
jgi:hypothetical protein